MSSCLTCTTKCCSGDPQRHPLVFLSSGDVERIGRLGKQELFEGIGDVPAMKVSHDNCAAFSPAGLCDIYEDRPEYCRIFPYNFMRIFIPRGELISERQRDMREGHPRWDVDALKTDHPEQLSGREARVFMVLYGCSASQQHSSEDIRAGMLYNQGWIYRNKSVIPHLASGSIEQLELANTLGKILAYCPLDI